MDRGCFVGQAGRRYGPACPTVPPPNPLHSSVRSARRRLATASAMRCARAGRRRGGAGASCMRCAALQERDGVAEALRLLVRHEAALVAAFPHALRRAFGTGPAPAHAAPAVPAEPGFDPLERMAESQVQDRVELVRAQPVVLHAAGPALAELSPYICAAQGLPSVRHERNPLRPRRLHPRAAGCGRAERCSAAGAAGLDAAHVRRARPRTGWRLRARRAAARRCWHGACGLRRGAAGGRACTRVTRCVSVQSAHRESLPGA